MSALFLKLQSTSVFGVEITLPGRNAALLAARASCCPPSKAESSPGCVGLCAYLSQLLFCHLGLFLCTSSLILAFAACSSCFLLGKSLRCQKRGWVPSLFAQAVGKAVVKVTPGLRLREGEEQSCALLPSAMICSASGWLTPARSLQGRGSGGSCVSVEE